MMSHSNPEEDPLWAMLKRWSRYAYSLSCHGPVQLHLRATVTTCQLPWAYDFCTKLSIMSEDLLGVVNFGISKAKERVARGTKSKDLWYHLVRLLAQLPQPL